MIRRLGLVIASQFAAMSLLLPTAAASESGYTRAQVAENNRAASCWTIINGDVYNLTEWVRQHPGGSGAILALCGIDGSGSFTSKHGGESRPNNELRKYYIGPLVTATSTPTTTPTPSAKPTSTPNPTATPTQAPMVNAKPVPKKRTIVCVKGKQIKRVTAVNPKCPNGFRRR